MTLPLNQIDIFTFVNIIGNPEDVKKQIEIIVRAGVDGVALRDTGERGVQFQLRTQEDRNTLTSARSAYRSYVQLIGQDPVSLTWHDVEIDAESVQFAVLDVQILTNHKLGASSGGLSTQKGAWLECRWTLLSVATVSS